MKSSDKYPSRRHFLKEAVVGSAALSTIPFSTISHDFKGTDKSEAIPKLPLKIMMKTNMPDTFKERLMGISADIQFIENEQSIADVNVWFGRIDQEQFKKASSLKWVHSSSAGVERYLFPELSQSDVLLTNAKGCYAPAIAEHTIGLLFTLTRKIGSQTRNMSNGKWSGENDMVEMKGMTMGIVGIGGIGSQIARRARAMDMRIIAVDIIPKYQEQIGAICDEVRLVQDHLPWLLSSADVVVSAAPHTKFSEGMFGEEQFNLMKKGAFFINVSRGKLVKTNALVAALNAEHLAGAGLDVTDPEPLPADHALWKLPNVIITSHISGRSQYSGTRMYEVFIENIHRYIHGFPLLNQVDKELGF